MLLKSKPLFSKSDKIAFAAIYTSDVFSVYDNGNLDSIVKKTREYNGTMTLDEIIKIGAGVCRHRSLFFKLICDKILSKDGISAAVDAGFSQAGHGSLSGHGHMWNYVQYDGKTEIVDVMHMQRWNMKNFSNPEFENYEYINSKYRVPDFKENYNHAFQQNKSIPLGLTPLTQFERKDDNKYYEANLRSKYLRGENFANAVLDKADLSCSDLSSTNLIKASLVNVKIQGADLFLTKISGANFTSADVSSSTLKHINASNTIFSNANLSKSKITESFFINADLTRANFSKASIGHVTFLNSNLTEINLDDSTLTETFFDNSIMDEQTYLKYIDKFKNYDFVPAKDFSETLPEYDKTRFNINQMGVLKKKISNF